MYVLVQLKFKVRYYFTGIDHKNVEVYSLEKDTLRFRILMVKQFSIVLRTLCEVVYLYN